MRASRSGEFAHGPFRRSLTRDASDRAGGEATTLVPGDHMLTTPFVQGLIIFGLPLSSFIVLLLIPGLIVAYQFYYCWQVYTGRRD